MLRSARQPYICWRCLTGAGDSASGLVSRVARLRSLPFPSRNRVVRRTLATAISQQHGEGAAHEDTNSGSSRRPESNLGVRDRLRAWENENQALPQTLLEDLPYEEMMGNFLTRTQTIRTFDEDKISKPDNPDMYDGDVLHDLRGQSSALQPGDLVETRFGGTRIPILGICIGRRRGYQWFYMNTGEVLAYQSLAALFTVTNYVDPAELQPLLQLLPDEPFTKPRNVLSHVHTPEALEAASKLQSKLTKFYLDAVSFHQSSIKYIDGISERVADPDKPIYLSLEQLADRLLPDFLRTEGRFSHHTLYAIHLGLQRDNWGFRPVNMRWHRRNYIYEVQPLSDVKLLTEVETKVRKLIDGSYIRDNPGKSLSLMKQNDLGRFILKARSAIEASRESRSWTPHGMIGPSRGNHDTVQEPLHWSDTDLKYIRFMELWACRRIIPDASQIDSLATTILRLTQMYTESDWVAHWTGFTFLQEIGWIPPWDIPARYDYRFPGVNIGRGGKMERPEIDVKGSMRPDIANGARRDWGDTRIFCIDSDQTADVDDGFSVEATDKPGEYWIHVHIADPASSIDPKSSLAAYLRDVPSSLYLPGFSEKMLPPGLERDFSLDPGKLTLTFSARMNENGDILDYQVQPGIVHNVVHMTKFEVSPLLPGLQPQRLTPDSQGYFAVGQEPSPPSPVKRITTAAELTEKDKVDLRLLDRLGEALKDRRTERGQLSGMPSRLPSPQVSFHSVSDHSPMDTKASMAWSGDPFIRFSQSNLGQSDRLVERMMHTAGEVAAKWCAARNIPIPYSTQPEALRNANELRTLRREVVDPLLAAGKPLPVNLLHRIFTLVGTSELSSRPAPFYSVGLDAYAKSSSPLRRYTDLVVHWQIHAALAHEREAGTGTSLTGTDCSELSALPWKRSELDPLLPVLQARQRQIREVDNRDGPAQWIYQALLRAWKFREAELPPTFAFEVDSVLHFGIRGRLRDFYGLGALVPLARMDVGMRLADVVQGDVFEVEIADINVVTMNVEVKILQRLESDVAERQGLESKTAE